MRTYGQIPRKRVAITTPPTPTVLRAPKPKGHGSSFYFDNTAAGLSLRYDIETLPTDVPLGTSNKKQGGKHSEALVAAVLWDLADSTNEDRDTLSNPKAVFDALKYLGGPEYTDRETSGAELVEFLDGWFCRGHGEKGDSNGGVEGNVVWKHAFNYDFKDQETCEIVQVAF